jgi:8-oxo-dGTP pyrophosphatase MutT (NUDIX family)
MSEVKCITLEGHTKIFQNDRLILRPAAFALIVHDGKLLLLRMVYTGKYHLPGGGINIGERMEQTIKREVLEETGIEVEVVCRVGGGAPSGLASVRRPNWTCSFPALQLSQRLEIILRPEKELSEIRFTSPISPYSLDVGRVFQPLQRHRLHSAATIYGAQSNHRDGGRACGRGPYSNKDPIRG